MQILLLTPTSHHHRTMSKSSITHLSTGWTFRNAKSAESYAVETVPSEIFVDLLAHKLIPDPFIAKNEVDVQWVGEEDWVYELAFRTPPGADGRKVELVFEGLDTFAAVTLNGILVLTSENMFTPARVDVTGVVLEPGDGKNKLSILFESAYLKGMKVVEKYPTFAWGCWNGDASRLAVRKAQYHYGWDWGPMLMSAGPWRPVYLESFSARIDDVYFRAELAPSLASATIVVTAEIVGNDAGKVVFKLTSPDGTSLKTASSGISAGKASSTFEVADPKLWWPHGYGSQPLYTLSASIDGDDVVKSKKLGLRRVRVQQKPLTDATGRSFYFEVNNTPLWCGGSNWIPADSFLTRVDAKKYRTWLQMIKDGNQIMVRVWAGGVYEHDVFYDICDELGLLVWQDFMFACGNYPAHLPSFRESVRLEATAAVKRLRHHPSIVIYAGNNEDYSYIWGCPNKLGYNAADKTPDNWLKTGFPARYIYEKLLPEVVAAHAPLTPYHRGSPYASEARPDGSDLNMGDTHQWNVWHGSQQPYQNWSSLCGRFVSEFGMQGFPSLATIKSYLPATTSSSETNPFSSTVEHHNKATGADRRLGLYLSENLPLPADAGFGGYVYSTQLLQSEALAGAFRAWRRNWKGPARESNAGALVWQINDCWPATSWALVDYHCQPKMAYFGVKRALEKVALGVKRRELRIPRDKYTNAHVSVEWRVDVWASNLHTAPDARTYRLTAKAFDAATGTLTADAVVRDGFTLPPNRSVELVSVAPLPGWDGKPDGSMRVVVAWYLIIEDTGEAVARYVDWHEPLKYVPVSRDAGVRVVTTKNGRGVRISAQKPVKGLVLEGVETEGAEGMWADNGVDVVPGETLDVGVGVGGVGGKGVVGRWMRNEGGVSVTVDLEDGDVVGGWVGEI